jgi:formamidopyrimidine-DNA glycosylase
MPELPEVEVAARNLRRWTKGRRIRAARAGAHALRVFRPAAPDALAALDGARFRDLRRIGKNLLITLDARRGGAIGAWSHLGLTGKWVRRAAGQPAPKNSRLDLQLDDGAHLHYVDPRMFGRFRLVPAARFDELPEIRALGPDPLTDGIDAAALHQRLQRTRLPIKVAIMDQALLPGVGNIQASESLFRAKIDPRRPAKSLSRAEVARLARAVRASIDFTLASFAEAGVDGGGEDIVYVEERRSANPFLVYGRAGEPCPRRKRGGRETITRIVQAQRSTFFCAACQR